MQKVLQQHQKQLDSGLELQKQQQTKIFMNFPLPITETKFNWLYFLIDMIHYQC